MDGLLQLPLQQEYVNGLSPCGVSFKGLRVTLKQYEPAASYAVIIILFLSNVSSLGRCAGRDVAWMQLSIADTITHRPLAGDGAENEE